MTRRPGPTVRTRVVEHLLDDSGDEVTRRHEDRLVGEEPLELRLTWPGFTLCGRSCSETKLPTRKALVITSDSWLE